MSETQSLSSLEALDRMMKLPVVENVWQHSQNIYGKVKNSNALINWTFNTTEGAVKYTTAMAAPIVHKLNGPIQFVDRTLVKGLDKLEISAPFIKETPQQIYEQTKTRIIETVQSHYEMACTLTAAGHVKFMAFVEVSMQKANIVLATRCGRKAVDGLDSTTALAERLLYWWLPIGEDENVPAATDDAPISAEENPAKHSIQTVGRLANRVNQRVHVTVLRQVEILGLLLEMLRSPQYMLLFGRSRSPAVTECSDN